MRRHKIRIRKYSDGNRPHLKFVVNYREAGKRKRSFFETKDQAESFAAFKNAELKRNGIAHAEFPERLRIMAQNAAEQLQPFGRTIADAVQHYVTHLKATERSCTAEQLVKELLEAKKADGVGERHLNDIRSRLGGEPLRPDHGRRAPNRRKRPSSRRGSAFAEKFNCQMVATITSAQLDDWLRSLNVSAVTRNHYRQLLLLAFNFALSRKYAVENPAENTAKAKSRRSAVGILTVSEAARLLEKATRDIVPYLAIGLFAGLRRAEIDRLDWSEIDFESNLIQVTAENSKTATRRLVTMQPNLREWLLPLREHGGSVTPANCFRQSFEQARAAAGIAEWPENALRHSFASYHLAHFKNAATTALELGHHDSRITFAHYRELVKPKDAASYWKIRPPAAKGRSKIVQMIGSRRPAKSKHGAATGKIVHITRAKAISK